jgi:hypothetical protein
MDLLSALFSFSHTQTPDAIAFTLIYSDSMGKALREKRGVRSLREIIIFRNDEGGKEKN